MGAIALEDRERGGGRRPTHRSRAVEGGPLLAQHDLLHVVAAAERRIGAGEKDAARLGIALSLRYRLLELLVGGPVERVADLGAVDRDGCDVVVELIADELSGHRRVAA
jgi:hypothetical protein